MLPNTMKLVSLLILATVLTTLRLHAQEWISDAEGSSVPSVVQISGTLQNKMGKPLSGVVGVTFALYQNQLDGAALWMETQNVTANELGQFTALLGGSDPNGLPLELFSSGQARWLGMQPSGRTEQPRTFLASVPYALVAVGGEIRSENALTKADSDKLMTVAENGNGNGTGEPSKPHRPITELTPGPGIIMTPNPITTTGTIEVDGSVLPNLEGENTFTGDQTFEGDVILSGSINDGLVIEPNPVSPNIIGGSSSNTMETGVVGGTIGGGGTAAEMNLVTGDFATVGGGSGNQAGGAPVTTLQSFATLGKGDGLGGNTAQFHIADGFAATVGGGSGNHASGSYSTVGGGQENTASGNRSTVGGGGPTFFGGNTASGDGSTVGGGESNEASGIRSTVGGGSNNIASGVRSTVAGGGGSLFVAEDGNTASGDFSAVGGGESNEASGIRSTVGGGGSNEAASVNATVGGGLGNKASNTATVGGGVLQHGQRVNFHRGRGQYQQSQR